MSPAASVLQVDSLLPNYRERPHDYRVGVKVLQAQIYLFIYLFFSKIALQLKRQIGESHIGVRMTIYEAIVVIHTGSGRLVEPAVSSLLLLAPPKNSPG